MNDDEALRHKKYVRNQDERLRPGNNLTKEKKMQTRLFFINLS
jgi:hypothetical protein